MQTFNIKRNNTSPSVLYALEPQSINLDGATCSFQMRRRRGVTVVDAPGVIHSIDPPILRYDWAAGDTAVKGSHQAEFEVTYGDGTIETFPNRGFITVSINEDV